MMRAGRLTIEGLSASYGTRRIVDDLSLGPYAPGTVVALVGPNGAGKSTLLRAIAGLVPTRGRILFAEADLTALSGAERSAVIGFMPQSLPDTIGLTVLEGVIGAVRTQSSATAWLDGGRARHRAVATLDRLGIAKLGLATLDRLSGGQRQLASLAQAIARDPPLLLLDEPVSALDLRHQFDVMALIRGVAGEGKTAIVVLHDLPLAARWADEIVMLRDGSVFASGKPDQVVTPDTLAAVYGVTADIDHGPDGELRISIRDTLKDVGALTASRA